MASEQRLCRLECGRASSTFACLEPESCPRTGVDISVCHGSLAQDTTYLIVVVGIRLIDVTLVVLLVFFLICKVSACKSESWRVRTAARALEDGLTCDEDFGKVGSHTMLLCKFCAAEEQPAGLCAGRSAPRAGCPCRLPGRRHRSRGVDEVVWFCCRREKVSEWKVLSVVVLKVLRMENSGNVYTRVRG